MTKELDAKMLFNLPPEKAIEYMENKGYKITGDWREMWEDAHAKAFTISKMTDAELLSESKDIINQALSEGWSSKKAEQELTNLYKKKGWWGKQVITDENGEEKEVQLGSPRRVRTIFRTNMQAAYSAQRYLEQLEDVDIAPYFQYIAIMDNRTRPEHAAMHEKIFRYDDPIWETMYPPNGFGCRCMVRSLSAEDVKRKGLKIEKSEGKLTTQKIDVGTPEGDINLKEITTYKTQDKAGNIYSMKTDAGWNYNVGKSAWNIDVLAYKKIAKLPQPVQDKFISDMALNPHSRDKYINWATKILNEGFTRICLVE